MNIVAQTALQKLWREATTEEKINAFNSTVALYAIGESHIDNEDLRTITNFVDSFNEVVIIDYDRLVNTIRTWSSAKGEFLNDLSKPVTQLVNGTVLELIGMSPDLIEYISDLNEEKEYTLSIFSALGSLDLNVED